VTCDVIRGLNLKSFYKRLFNPNLEEWGSEKGAALKVDSFGRGAVSQGTSIKVISPPTQANVLQPQTKIQKHCHEGKPCIKCPREHIVVTLPPLWLVPEHNKTRKKPHNDPTCIVHCSRGRHHSSGTDQHRHIYQSYPLLLWEAPRCHPHHYRSHCSSQEEPVYLLVASQVPENSSWPYQTPNNRCVVEHCVTWTRPHRGWVFAYVWDCLH